MDVPNDHDGTVKSTKLGLYKHQDKSIVGRMTSVVNPLFLDSKGRIAVVGSFCRLMGLMEIGLQGLILRRGVSYMQRLGTSLPFWGLLHCD